MASLVTSSRQLVQASRRRICRNVGLRGIRSAARSLAAQDFTMPAMSPTMTEGNIASWKVKEGDKFSTGDVLLEIETDKAQMDVEAQDDGVMARIMAQDGTKGIKVGTRIAVLAELDDDLSKLEIPEEKAKSTKPSKAELKPEPSESKSKASTSVDSEKTPDPSNTKTPTSASTSTTSTATKSSKKANKQKYPLYPSVIQIFHENGLESSEADKISATGPNGRLLKGDVLAHIGKIKPSYPSEQSGRIEKLEHLDLSNIKIAAPAKGATPAKTTEASSPPQVEKNVEVTVSVSFKAIRDVQQRIRTVLGVDMSIETFVARAIDLSNEDLPGSASKAPTADELFNSVLGLDKVRSSSSRGHFVPQVMALPQLPIMPSKAKGSRTDIIDILGSPRGRVKQAMTPGVTLVAGSEVTNVFRVSVPKEQEKRAQVFLERLKTVLQVDPGRLVL